MERRKAMRKRLLGLGLVAALAMGLLTGGGPAVAAGKARLNVVHGIPGVTVNVCVDGTNAIPNFAPGDVVKNVSLAATSHTFKIVAKSDHVLDRRDPRRDDDAQGRQGLHRRRRPER
jgi:hypothetical protein